MPNVVRKGPAAGQIYGRPWRGIVEYVAQISVSITGLTSREIDGYGFLKPGVPLKADGTLISGAAQVVFGVTIEPLDVLNLYHPTSPISGATLTAAIAAATSPQQVVVGTIGQVLQDVIEDNLGAVLTANEIAGFNLAGSLIHLL